MQLRLWTAAIIFLGSYLPLSLILLAQDADYGLLSSPICWNIWFHSECASPLGHPEISLAVFVLCLGCFLFTLFVLRLTSLKKPIQITSATHVPSELMNYTLPYVVSFMGVGYDETGKFVGVAIFLGWMFLITFRSGQIILNPILTVFDWRLYEIEYKFPGNNDTYKTTALISGDPSEPVLAKHSYIQDIMIAKVEPIDTR